MASEFEKWWENTGFFLAKKKDLLGEGTTDAVEVARLAYEAGLYTAPPPMVPIGKDPGYEFKSHYIRCNCGGDMLQVERYDYRDGDEGFNFSMWSRGMDGKKLIWRERFRWCWNILRTGRPWADDIIATNQDAKGLAEFILQNLPK